MKLDENCRRHMVVGICFNNFLVPTLRKCIDPKLRQHHEQLAYNYNIATTENCLVGISAEQKYNFTYDNDNPDYNQDLDNHPVPDHHILAKLYLLPYMRHFDHVTEDAFEGSAALTVMEKAKCFEENNVQSIAHSVRDNIRNKWAHCDYTIWNDKKFKQCFGIMKSLLKAIEKIAATTCDIQTALDNLNEWQKTGEAFLGEHVHPSVIEEVLDQHRETMKIIANHLEKFGEMSDLEKQFQGLDLKEWNKLKDLDVSLKKHMEDLTSDLIEIERRVEQNEKDIQENKGTIKRHAGEILDTQVKTRKTESNLAESQEQIDQNTTGISENRKEIQTLKEEAGSGSIALKETVPDQNPYFQERLDVLKTIRKPLLAKERSCVVVHGMGGVGKTTSAIETAEKLRKDFSGGVHWVTSDNDEKDTVLRASISSLLGKMATTNNDDLVCSVTNLFCKADEKQMIVIDNLDAEEPSELACKLIKGIWKTCQQTSILITTRLDPVVIEEILPAQKIRAVKMPCFSLEESQDFLRKRTGKGDFKEEDLTAIHEELGGLPLALDQAAAYIKHAKYTVFTLSKYVQKLQEDKLKVLEKKKATTTLTQVEKGRLAVQTTWSMNIDAMKEECPAAERVIQVFALLDPEGIPKLINNKGEPEFPDAKNFDTDDITIAITKWSLFSVTSDGHYFTVHRLVQEIIMESFVSDQSVKPEVVTNSVRMLLKALHSTSSPREYIDRKETWGISGLNPEIPCCSEENLQRLFEEYLFSLREWDAVVRNVRMFLTSKSIMDQTKKAIPDGLELGLVQLYDSARIYLGKPLKAPNHIQELTQKICQQGSYQPFKDIDVSPDIFHRAIPMSSLRPKTAWDFYRCFRPDLPPGLPTMDGTFMRMFPKCPLGYMLLAKLLKFELTQEEDTSKTKDGNVESVSVAEELNNKVIQDCFRVAIRYSSSSELHSWAKRELQTSTKDGCRKDRKLKNTQVVYLSPDLKLLASMKPPRDKNKSLILVLLGSPKRGRIEGHCFHCQELMAIAQHYKDIAISSRGVSVQVIVYGDDLELTIPVTLHKVQMTFNDKCNVKLWPETGCSRLDESTLTKASLHLRGRCSIKKSFIQTAPEYGIKIDQDKSNVELLDSNVLYCKPGIVVEDNAQLIVDSCNIQDIQLHGVTVTNGRVKLVNNDFYSIGSFAIVHEQGKVSVTSNKDSRFKKAKIHKRVTIKYGEENNDDNENVFQIVGADPDNFDIQEDGDYQILRNTECHTSESEWVEESDSDSDLDLDSESKSESESEYDSEFEAEFKNVKMKISKPKFLR